MLNKIFFVGVKTNLTERVKFPPSPKSDLGRF